MSNIKNTRSRSKIKIRKKISGTSARPRLSVFRSLNNIYGQLIDDTTGKTILSVSSLSSEVKSAIAEIKGKVSKSKVVGKVLAEKALAQNINTVVFDRSGYRYHGRVKSLADGAREGGLKF